jgi:hypothetical protein
MMPSWVAHHLCYRSITVSSPEGAAAPAPSSWPSVMLSFPDLVLPLAAAQVEHGANGNDGMACFKHVT